MLHASLKDCELPKLSFTLKNESKSKQDFSQQQESSIQFNDVTTTTLQDNTECSTQTQVLPIEYTEDYDKKALSSFLQKTLPQLEEYLTSPQTTLLNSLKEAGILRSHSTLLHCLSFPSHSAKNQGLEILDLEWNSSGVVLAASIGQLQHDSYSEETTYLYIWQLNNKLDKSRPQQLIECPTSIMSLAFHPQEPHLLAGGGFNGQVYLWDLSKPDPLLYQSEVGEIQGHKEVVSQVTWIETGRKQYRLLSTSTDGKLLIWEEKLRFPQRGYLLIRKKNNEVGVIGTLCCAQSLEDKNTLVIGTEVGSLYKLMIVSHEKPFQQKKWNSEACQVMAHVNPKFIPEIQQQVETFCQKYQISDIGPQEIYNARPNVRKFYPNPLGHTTNYEAHLAPVYSVDYSPFFKQYFLTGSLDGMVRLYDQSSNKCLFFIDFDNHYVMKVQWSLSRATVFTVVLSNGVTHVFDLSISTKIPVETLTYVDEKLFGYALEYNKKNKKLLAVGYQNCQIGIYELQDQLCETYNGTALYTQ